MVYSNVVFDYVNFFSTIVRPSKPPPPPRSLPPVAKVPPKSSSAVTSEEIISIADYLDTPKTCDSSASDETYEPVNFSAPECDHSSPEMARLTSMQYYGSETESEIYPTIQFGDDVSIIIITRHQWDPYGSWSNATTCTLTLIEIESRMLIATIIQ